MILLALFIALIPIGISVLLFFLAVNYIFKLRQRQNEEFLTELGYVVRDSVRDALNMHDVSRRK